MQRDPDASRLVGRYMVHRRIAAGGMATVHLGRLLGVAGFSRTVAIKRLHDNYAHDPEFVAMLLDEARLASNIRHPNVVPTIDVVAENDELLVVMDYVEGDSLAHIHKLLQTKGQERFPINIASAILAHALHGLHAAHEARGKNGEPLGIVHRDVSPQNILVGVDGVARVLDFGIAKAASRASTTEDGQLKGKTAYMSPEQLSHGSVDRRTDVWASAIILWELITGRRLFLGDTPAQTMSKVLSEPIDPPQRWNPEAPLDLCAIVMRGLERDPSARFATAEEMALAIEDAMPVMPRAKEIGAFVTRVAKATVEARAALVREIERVSAPVVEAAASTDPELRAAMAEAERKRQAAEQETVISGEVGAVSSSALRAVPSAAPSSGLRLPRDGFRDQDLTDLQSVKSTTPPPPKGVSRMSLVIGIFGGVALVAAAAILLIFLKFSSRARADGSGPPLSAPSASIVVVEAAPPPPPPAPSASSTTAATAASAMKKPVGRQAPPPPPAVKANTPDCRIPYTVDEKGLKHFKVECL